MIVKELKEILNRCCDEKVVLIKDRSGGWCNIDYIEDCSITVDLIMEKEPLFSNGE